MFGRFKRLYFVGIGGSGMSGIAEILHNLGYQVSGSDSTPSEITEYLQSKGVRIYSSHNGDNVRDVDVMVISSAIHEDNPEYKAAKERGIPVIKRAEMLGELMRLKFSIGVAGTHGKTTTTSMIGRILQQAHLNPTIIVGGVVAELGTGAALGTGEYLVAEADEYDKSFLAMFPSMAVVLNIEPDHLECYNGLEDLHNSFLMYMNRVPFYGNAIICADDPVAMALKPRISRPFATFGVANDADYRAVNVEITPEHTRFWVYHREDLLGGIVLRVPGRHNVMNALAAIAATREINVPFLSIADALLSFKGVGRRFEYIGTANDVTVIDDYAHHPTEIKATLTAAKAKYPSGRIIAVFQPHLYSRTQAFMKEFAEALALADIALLTDIYPARELPIPGVTSDGIRLQAERMGKKNFEYVGVKDNAVDKVAEIARPGDVVILIGAGSITHIKRTVLDRLQSL